MHAEEVRSRLKYISPDELERNPENPRLYFRPEELDQLMVSINQIGVQVPVTVYEDGGRYYLLDGERRWICAKKLNLEKIPALVRPKPSALENLLLMYNIHALREQWDYFTIARSLQRIIDLFRKERRYSPTENDLSVATGLSRGTIRRCQLLLDLPSKYQRELQDELLLPKSTQKISEDTLIEMERSLKAVTRRFPQYVPNLDNVRDALLVKVRRDDIKAVTDFRQLSKIATTSEKLGLNRARVTRALDRVFDVNVRVGIRETFERIAQPSLSVSGAEREAEHLVEYLSGVDDGSALPREFVTVLRQLRKELARVLGTQR
jgi:ParB/RepB/Spo0J family partition protein